MIKKGRIKSKYLSKYHIQNNMFIVDILNLDIETGKISIYPFLRISDRHLGFGYRKPKTDK